MNRIRNRKSRLESLERRNLLTTFVDFAPTNHDSFVIQRDPSAPVELSVLWNNSRSDVITSVAGVDHGTATIGADGKSILFQPTADFVGIDALTLTIGTDQSSIESYTQEIAVNVIDPILAVDDWYQVDVSSQGNVLDVLANDTFNGRFIGRTDKTDLNLQLVSTEGNGQVEIDDQGELVYTPATGFEGVETIHYTAVNADGLTAEGIVQVRVSDQTSDAKWPEQLQQELVVAAVQANQYSFGARDYGYPEYYFALDSTVPVVRSQSANDVSGTNNQLENVDESDRVKTDGDYLYVLSSLEEEQSWWNIFPRIGFPEILGFAEGEAISDDGQTAPENMLSVIDIRQPDSPTIVSRQVFNDKVLSLDLNGNRLTVLSERDDDTVVTVLDIAQADAVETVSTTVVDGRFQQARRVGETLYVFTSEYGHQFPKLEKHCASDASSDVSSSSDEMLIANAIPDSICFFESGQEYLSRVREALIASVFPSESVFSSTGELVRETVVVDPLTAPLPNYHQERLNIISFDTSADEGGSIDWDITDTTHTILVTPNSIYVTETDYSGAHDFFIDIDGLTVPQQPTISTAIERFEIQEDGTVELSATGEVPGVLNNSFSIDEYEGRLRIATENSWWSVTPDDDGSSVYVLEQNDQSLDVIGGVTGLAPGEQIYAVRFAETRAYVVTFRQVDPLFVIDFTTPSEPVVLGQLKAPGYSQYLQVLDENHVLGVGRDADEETGLYKGLIVSLFDVTDPTDPIMEDRYEFEGGRSTFSPFADSSPFDLRDHHAISYFSNEGVLALPIYSEPHRIFGDAEQPIFEGDQSAVRTLRIDTENGISELDWVQFETSRVDRTVRVGDYLYSLSNKQLIVTNLLQPDGQVASLMFEREGQDDFVDVNVGEAVDIDVMDNDGIESEFVEILAAELVQGEGTVEVMEDKIRFTPSSRSLAHQQIRYTARDAAGTLIDAVATIDPDLIWQNVNSALDVNEDGVESARDAVNVINLLVEYGNVTSEEIEQLIGDADLADVIKFDATGDGRLSALDALWIINGLNQESVNPGVNGTAEAEATDMVFASAVTDDDDDEVASAVASLF